MYIKKLKYLVVFLVISFNSMAMGTMQKDSVVDNSEVVIRMDPQLGNKKDRLFVKINNNSSVVPVNNHRRHAKRDSIILHDTPSRLGIIIQNLRNTEKFKKVEQIIRNNRNGIKVACTIATVLLLHFYYAEESSFTYNAQKLAGISLAQYCSYKKMNLFLMSIFFECFAEAIFLASVKWDFYTGLSTVCDLAALFSLIYCLNDNLLRKMIGKNRSQKNENNHLQEHIIIPTKYKNLEIVND